MFQGMLITNDENGYRSQLQTLDDSYLADGDVRVKIDYSTLNYKDALAVTGKSPIIRQFPLIAGVDFAGTVIESQHPRYQTGDAVVLNGWGVGEKTSGGLAQEARVSGDWLLPLPALLTTRQAMAVGTAGYTAMLAINALEQHGIMPASGPILVTGANGGVGHFAISFLAKLGYHVIAATGRTDQAEHLRALGAKEILDRETLNAPGKPLGKMRWAAAIDSLGSHTLANVCAGLQYGGVVAACGLAQGMDFPATVAPFILRGVTLVGIDSVMAPFEKRQAAWQRLANLIDDDLLAQTTAEIGLSDVIEMAPRLLAGEIRGRLVVDVNR
ncbi:MAG TPA: MDR family oxidoreductase [Lactobacillaceae bacterium]|jgi:acrylyl-CoA reductase (NADPH)